MMARLVLSVLQTPWVQLVLSLLMLVVVLVLNHHQQPLCTASARARPPARPTRKAILPGASTPQNALEAGRRCATVDPNNAPACPHPPVSPPTAKVGGDQHQGALEGGAEPAVQRALSSC